MPVIALITNIFIKLNPPINETRLIIKFSPEVICIHFLGDAVTIIVEKASSYETDNLTAIQVLITDEAVMDLDNFTKSPP